MNDHPHDSLPAFVLGALDADEAIQVTEHISICSTCRDAAEEFRAAVAMLPYATQPHDPPPHVKHELFARITADAGPPPAGAVLPHPAGMAREMPAGWARLIGVVTALSLALSLTLILITLDTRGRLEQQGRIVTFILSPATVNHTLIATARAPSAGGKMYMQPGHNRVMLVVAGLRPPGQGKIYRSWFESPGGQVPGGTFTVDQDGEAELFVDMPGPVDSYRRVVVTVEDAGDGQAPSDEVVLWASFRD